MPRPPSLTLIVAAAYPSLGIGSKGVLPWRLKQEMAYFARVTTRTPAVPATDAPLVYPPPVQNAVIMGRKTWASLPPRFRPLKDRINVVLSRQTPPVETSDTIWVQSLEGALRVLAGRQGVGTVFVIGGAEVYRSALGMGATERVLLTKVYGEWGCDVFFPVDLEREGGWRRRSREEMSAFVGEEVGGRVREGDVEFECCMFERVE
ncbi:hypothetical protein EJ06DRAFT_400149 [Trichodelitschia bisporula]|uniref:Dihydrofolate reductase n=1 Tax=Trichodelitschia bisporula TaxID=703511 RepID=A0A6G1HXQ3_9PEZI|nr:hypothetical protein EJ06DRAFT_400149 [Trichodelitschia bisporula]